MKDAVKALKKDFGSNAVILSTKEKISPSGHGKIYEVTAASANQPGDSKEQSIVNIDKHFTPILTKLNTIHESIPSKKTIESTALEISELKAYLMEVLKSKEGSLFENLSPDLISLEKQLRFLGVSQENIIEILHLKNITPLTPPSAIPTDKASNANIRNEVCKWIFKNIRISPKWNSDSAQTQFKIIIGPFGSGKSTLVSKLASLYSKIPGYKVAVLSIDCSRIAASDQMRIFCKILGLPFYTASNQDELLKVSKSLESHLVFVDSPGFGSKDRHQVEFLKNLFNDSYDAEYHLCLSNTDKELYNESFIQLTLPLCISSLSFTKIDESLTYGELFNLTKKWSIPLGHFSYGSCIMDEFERASKERVIERLFGKI